MRGNDEFKRAQGPTLNPPETEPGAIPGAPGSVRRDTLTLRERLAKVAGGLRVFMDILPGLTFNQISTPLEYINTGYSVTTGGKLVAGFNINRGYLMIQNHDSAINVYISFGSNKVTRNSVKVIAGGYYEPLIAPVSDVYVIAEAGAATNPDIVVVEGIPSSLKRGR